MIGDLTSTSAQGRAQHAHQILGDGAPDLDGLRAVVRSSWLRSLDLRSGAAPAPAPGDFLDELERYRRAHPIAAVMPVIDRLLIQPSASTGLLVAVGDELGNLLWVEGDDDVVRQAESRSFAPGMDWSEAVMGTSAPGTALATGTGVQISGAEHLSELAHIFSCTAVPLHDPDTGAVIGVVDITGGPDAVAAHTLTLVRATVAAAEAELRIARLVRDRDGAGPRPRGRSAVSPALHRDTLQITGRDRGLLSLDGTSRELSLRHTEILTLLSRHPDGLTAQELADLLYIDPDPTTLRAELVRLRRVLAGLGAGNALASHPYRLTLDLTVDADQVVRYVRRGAHRLALNLYRGRLLPRSTAPGIAALRAEVSAQLRESMLADAGPDALMTWLDLPEAADDVDAWRLALAVLPPRSPRRAGVVAHLESRGH
ncbi:GAF domain-containing protein [Tersicoccus sp. Bi-70]|uniref:GAF domain-containing protein n=1 Tax=Tersicoccus sp. Bi-70 TaxID=1897634 RepID=UPI00097859EF|nr:GAF domain-containing protein [Tersicoccus sp. Bi-70]OMH34259.1 transcriptional regulator [Tersicoccus sp. Bi-70]